MLGEVAAMRADLSALMTLVVERRSLPAPAAIPIVDAPASIPVVVERPSLAVKAAKGTTHVGKVVMIAAGILSVAGQVVALWKPEAGPIVEALRLLASLGGG